MDRNTKLKAIIGIDEIKNCKVLLRQLFAEFLGTFLYLIMLLSIYSEDIGVLTTAMSNGLALATIIQIIGHVSGGHVNPAVTFGVLVIDQIKILRALLYIAAQVLGAFAGTLLSRGIMDFYSEITDLKKDYQVLFLEFLMSFIFVLVVLSVVDVKRGAGVLGSAALVIGLSLAACQCSSKFYPLTLNPAASLGVAFVFNSWTHHWAYWLGPISGGICAGIIYRFVLTFKLRSLIDG